MTKYSSILLALLVFSFIPSCAKSAPFDLNNTMIARILYGSNGDTIDVIWRTEENQKKWSLMSENKKFWVWNGNREVEVQLNESPEKGVWRLSQKVIEPDSHNQQYVLLSTSKFPKQKWAKVNLGSTDQKFVFSAAIKKFENERELTYEGPKNYNDPGFDSFLIDLKKDTRSYVVNTKGNKKLMFIEFPIGNYQHVFMVLEDKSGKWNEVLALKHGGFERKLWLDVSGDGIPEFFSCNDGHYDCELASYYPMKKRVLHF